MEIIRIRISSPRIILLRVIFLQVMASKIRQVISSRILQTAIRPETPVISRRGMAVIPHRETRAISRQGTVVIPHRETRAISLQEIQVILHREMRDISHRGITAISLQEMRAILRREIPATSRQAAAITGGSMHHGSSRRTVFLRMPKRHMPKSPSRRW